MHSTLSSLFPFNTPSERKFQQKKGERTCDYRAMATRFFSQRNGDELFTLGVHDGDVAIFNVSTRRGDSLSAQRAKRVLSRHAKRHCKGRKSRGNAIIERNCDSASSISESYILTIRYDTRIARLYRHDSRDSLCFRYTGTICTVPPLTRTESCDT
jgi:hypothetical protein